MTTSKRKALASAVASICGIGLLPGLAHSATLEEVLVTATKRSQTAQEIPYNISALTSDSLSEFSINNMGDLGKVVPGVTVNDVGARTGFRGTGINIRGITATSPSLIHSPAKNDPVIGMYLDDTPLFVNLQFMDVARVEVLRGPQGTLYGSGSMGGNVRYVLEKPSSEALAGEIIFGAGKTSSADDYNSEIGGILNIPVTDRLALRLNARYREDAGFMDYNNLVVREPGSRFDPQRRPELADPDDILTSDFVRSSRDDADESNTKYFRAAARYEGERVDATLNVIHQELEADSSPFYRTNSREDSTTSPNGLLTPFESDADLVSLEVAVDLGFASLTSSTAQTKTEGRGFMEMTGLYVSFDFYTAYYGSSPRPFMLDDSYSEREVFTQEFRLTSQSEGDVDWLLGVYYSDQEADGRTDQYYPGYDDYANACFPVFGFASPECGYGTIYGVYPDNGGVPIIRDMSYLSRFQDEFEELAVFGELTYRITDTWQVTGGFRWFQHDYSIDEIGGLMFVPDFVISTSDSTDYDDSIFKLNTSWQFHDDHKIYATWSEGFRRGGKNALGPFGTPDTSTYDPDKLENREIGLKGMFGDGISYTIAYYDIDWDDVQVFSSACSFLALICYVNGGEAESKGVEVEVTAQLTDTFRLQAGFTTNEAEFVDPSTFLSEVSGVSSGDRLAGTPRKSGNISGVYERPLGNGWILSATGTVAYSDSRPSAVDSRINETLPSYTTVDASIGLSNESWSVRLLGDNLTDERARVTAYSTLADTGGWGAQAPSVARRPRTLGLLVNYRF